MARKPVIKKEDILSAAHKLFSEKGVDDTSVSDIVKEAHVAQGTFYNYYKSKDEIFAAVLEKATDNIIEKVRETAEADGLTPAEKIGKMVLTDFKINRTDDSLFAVLHEDRYAGAHQKYIVNRINKLKPIYAEVIRQGNKTGCFNTQFPEEAAAFFLVGTKFVFDPAFFTYDEKSMLKMVKAVDDFAERILGAVPGTFTAEKMEQGIIDYFRSERK